MKKVTLAQNHTRFTSEGFTLIEILIAVAIIGILAAIAVPQYLNYISGARQKAADNSLEQFSILLESYRAETGEFPANNTYTYTEDGSGNVTADTISGQLPDFLPRSASANQTSFHYSVIVSNTGTVNEQAIVIVTGVGDHSGSNAAFVFK